MRRFLSRRGALAALAVLPALLASGAGSPAAASAVPRTETAVFAGGCFWGTTLVFENLKGVTDVVAGYAGGAGATAHYEVVSTGMTGHAESVRVTFDPDRVSYGQLLHVFFTVAHDPTERDRQGPDDGPQYRSVVFFATPAQQHEAEDVIRSLTAAKIFAAPIVTEVVPLRGFYPAEAYHQHFAARNPSNPYIVYNDAPKLATLRHRYPTLAKS